MAICVYQKYEAIQIYSMVGNSNIWAGDTSSPGCPDYKFNPYTGVFSLLGNYTTPTRGNGYSRVYYLYPEGMICNGYVRVLDDDGGRPYWDLQKQSFTKVLINPAITNPKGNFQCNVSAEEGTYPEDGPHTDGFWYTRLKSKAPTPDRPQVDNITTTSARVTCSTPGSQVRLIDGQTGPSGSTFYNLVPNNTYNAWAFMPADTHYIESDASQLSIFKTLKIPSPPPNYIRVSNLTSTSVTLTSESGSMIVCNNQTKSSGSTWEGLVPNTAYNCCAYMPETSTLAESARTSLNFNTLGIAIKIMANGVVKTSDTVWVKVGGGLRKVESMWVKINGALRKI